MKCRQMQERKKEKSRCSGTLLQDPHLFLSPEGPEVLVSLSCNARDMDLTPRG